MIKCSLKGNVVYIGTYLLNMQGAIYHLEVSYQLHYSTPGRTEVTLLSRLLPSSLPPSFLPPSSLPTSFLPTSLPPSFLPPYLPPSFLPLLPPSFLPSSNPSFLSQPSVAERRECVRNETIRKVREVQNIYKYQNDNIT